MMCAVDVTAKFLFSGVVEVGPNLPKQSTSHCIVMINASAAMLIGDYTDGNRTSWFFDFENVEHHWIEGPYLNTGRVRHACAVIEDSEITGQMLVIVAGGYEERSTESFVLGGTQLQTWILGPDLPYKIALEGVTSPDKQTMLLLGRYVHDVTQKVNIYTVNCYWLNCNLNEVDQALISRQSFLVAFIPDSVLNCTEIVSITLTKVLSLSITCYPFENYLFFFRKMLLLLK